MKHWTDSVFVRTLSCYYYYYRHHRHYFTTTITTTRQQNSQQRSEGDEVRGFYPEYTKVDFKQDLKRKVVEKNTD